MTPEMVHNWSVLEEALWWNRQGVNVLPIRYQDKRPYPGAGWSRWKTKIQGECLVRWWFERKYKKTNIGVMCGEVVVIDFDSYPAWYAWKPKGEIKESLSARTGRGVHVYFWVREKIWQTLDFANGEIKGNGYVVAPPSIHPSGRPYRWMGGSMKTIGTIDELGVRYRVQQEVAIEHHPQRRVLTKSTGIVGKIKRTLGIANYLSTVTGGFVYNGESLMCSCPFHNDKDPSMVVHNNEGWCYCFSPQCKAHKRLDVIDVAALLYNVGNSEAIRVLSYEVD